jgi:predicted  nucleic acid-binding Zn-ribbon protein
VPAGADYAVEEVAMTDGAARPKRSFGVRETIILLLAAGMVAALWRVQAMAQERDDLSTQLIAERQARAATELSLNALKYQVASSQLNSDVHKNIIDERIVEAQKQAADLQHQAEALREEKVREANCVTPKSVRDASGL